MDGLILGMALPFIGTALGAACVLFMKERMPLLLQKGLTGFAAGVMVAASVWSLLITSMEMTGKEGFMSVLPDIIGFTLGIGFLLLLEILPYLLAFAAGAMMYVVVEELIPGTQEGAHSNWGTVGFAIGFLPMMVLDIVLG